MFDNRVEQYDVALSPLMVEFIENPCPPGLPFQVLPLAAIRNLVVFRKEEFIIPFVSYQGATISLCGRGQLLWLAAYSTGVDGVISWLSDTFPEPEEFIIGLLKEGISRLKGTLNERHWRYGKKLEDLLIKYAPQLEEESFDAPPVESTELRIPESGDHEEYKEYEEPLVEQIPEPKSEDDLISVEPENRVPEEASNPKIIFNPGEEEKPPWRNGSDNAHELSSHTDDSVDSNLPTEPEELCDPWLQSKFMLSLKSCLKNFGLFLPNELTELMRHGGIPEWAETTNEKALKKLVGPIPGILFLAELKTGDKLFLNVERPDEEPRLFFYDAEFSELIPYFEKFSTYLEMLYRVTRQKLWVGCHKGDRKLARVLVEVLGTSVDLKQYLNRSNRPLQIYPDEFSSSRKETDRVHAEILEIEPSNVYSLTYSGYRALSRGKVEEAEQFFVSATHSESSFLNAWFGLGRLYEMRRSWNDAVLAYVTLLKRYRGVGAHNSPPMFGRLPTRGFRDVGAFLYKHRELLPDGFMGSPIWAFVTGDRTNYGAVLELRQRLTEQQDSRATFNVFIWELLWKGVEKSSRQDISNLLALAIKLKEDRWVDILKIYQKRR